VLYKTQPAVTHTLKNIEEKLGIGLFVKKGRSLELTEKGQYLYQHCLRFEEHYASLTASTRHLQTGLESKIAIAVDSLCPKDLFVKSLQIIKDIIGPAELEVSFEVLSGVEERLLHDSFDLGISPFCRHPQDIEATLWGEMTLVPVIKELPETGLANIPQIIVRDTARLTASHEKMTVGVQESGRKWFVSDHALKKDLICTGLGWGSLELSSIATELKEKRLFELHYSLVHRRNFPLYILKRKSKASGPLVQKILKALHDE
jgi:DNA-binding transcriptional LysR family regulator